MPSDIAVLTRVNATIAPVQVALATPASRSPAALAPTSSTASPCAAALAWLRLATGGWLEQRRPRRGDPPAVAGFSPRLASGSPSRTASTGCCASPTGSPTARTRPGSRVRRRHRPHAGAGVGRRRHGRPAAVLVDEIGLGRAVASLDHNRHGMNRGAQSDDLVALRQIAALHPAPGRFRRVAARLPCRHGATRRGRARPPSTGSRARSGRTSSSTWRSPICSRTAWPRTTRRSGACSTSHSPAPRARSRRHGRRPEPVRRRADERAAGAPAGRAAASPTRVTPPAGKPAATVEHRCSTAAG